jgi:hypothetical protein
VIAKFSYVMNFNLGDAALNLLIELAPKLANLGLGLCIGSPVVANMLVLAGQLAVIAAGALRNIDNKRFTHMQTSQSRSVDPGA